MLKALSIRRIILDKIRQHAPGSKEIDGRLEPLQNYSTLKGHNYSRKKRRPIWTQMQIVEALQLGDRNTASILLSKMGQEYRSLKTIDFIHILEHCARSADPVFVKETERMMREEGVIVDEKCYTLIIRALCRGGLIEEAFNEINIIRDNRDFGPTLPMLNDLLGGCAESQSHRASECLDLMEDQLVGKNEITYTQLLKLAVSGQNISLVREIWNDCTKYYSPNILLLQKFVWSFSWLGDLESAYDILQKMVSLSLRGGFVISESAGGRFFISSRLDVPMPSREITGKYEKSKFMDGEKLAICTSNNENNSIICSRRNDILGDKIYHEQSVVTLLRLAFNAVIHAFARESNYTLAEQLFLQMQDLGVEPSANTYDGLIKAAVAQRGYVAGLELVEKMRQKKMNPKDSTLEYVSVACSNASELDLAETLLDQISTSRNVRPYNFFLQACDIMDKPERALRALAKMKKNKFVPDMRTYEVLFSLFINCNAPYEDGNILLHVDVNKRIKAIEDDMVENNLQHSATSMKNLLRSLGAEGMVNKLIQYFRMAENQLSRGYNCLETSTYNVVLHSLIKAEETQMAIELFKSMKLNGFPPDASTYDIMINCCRIIKSYKSACTLISVMIRNGFYPQAVTYTSLIKILLVNGDIDEALRLLEEGIIEGIAPDVVLYNTILKGAQKKKRIDVIEFLVDQMRKKNIQPDSSTCISVFSAYLDQNYINTAMEALQVLSMRMISQEDSFLEKNKMELEENFIFAEDSEAESRILRLFEYPKEDLVVALLNLRWCATLGFPISWSPNESIWSKRLSSNYNTYRRSGSRLIE